MRDETFLQQLSAYVDGELPENQADRLEAQLAESPVMMRQLSELRKLSELIGAARNQRLAQVQISRLHQRLQQYRDRIILRTAKYAAAAAAAVLMACGITLWHEAHTAAYPRGEADTLDSIVLAISETNELGNQENGLGGDIQFATWLVSALSRNQASE